MVNPFLSIRALTQSREDLLTEFFAGALTIDEGLRRRYAVYVLRPLMVGTNIDVLSIVSIATQVQFSGTACIPDMVLTLSDGRRIIVEHKIDAAETMGYVDKEEDEELRAQLLRYLDLDVGGVLYVRANWKPPVDAVLNNRKYIRHRDRAHFIGSRVRPLHMNNAGKNAGIYHYITRSNAPYRPLNQTLFAEGDYHLRI